MSTSYSWEGKAGMAHSDCGWMCGCAGKTVKSIENMCHTWALLWWWFTTKRCYIKCMHLFTTTTTTTTTTVHYSGWRMPPFTRQCWGLPRELAQCINARVGRVASTTTNVGFCSTGPFFCTSIHVRRRSPRKHCLCEISYRPVTQPTVSKHFKLPKLM